MLLFEVFMALLLLWVISCSSFVLARLRLCTRELLSLRDDDDESGDEHEEVRVGDVSDTEEPLMS